MLEKAQTEITHDACLGFFVTFIQRDEEERAGVRCSIAPFLRPYSPPNPLFQYGESDRQMQIYTNSLE